MTIVETELTEAEVAELLVDVDELRWTTTNNLRAIREFQNDIREIKSLILQFFGHQETPSTPNPPSSKVSSLHKPPIDIAPPIPNIVATHPPLLGNLATHLIIPIHQPPTKDAKDVDDVPDMTDAEVFANGLMEVDLKDDVPNLVDTEILETGLVDVDSKPILKRVDAMPILEAKYPINLAYINCTKDPYESFWRLLELRFSIPTKYMNICFVGNAKIDDTGWNTECKLAKMQQRIPIVVKDAMEYDRKPCLDCCCTIGDRNIIAGRTIDDLPLKMEHVRALQEPLKTLPIVENYYKGSGDHVYNNYLISEYSTSDQALAATKLFVEIGETATTSWNSMIGVYSNGSAMLHSNTLIKYPMDDDNSSWCADSLHVCLDSPAPLDESQLGNTCIDTPHTGLARQNEWANHFIADNEALTTTWSDLVVDTTRESLEPEIECQEPKHNVAGEKIHDEYTSNDYFDAAITPLGSQQLDKLWKHVQACGFIKKVPLVIVSHLTRRRHTSVGVFGGGDCTDGVDVPPLMSAIAGENSHAGISSLDSPPFLSVELCSESLAVHSCDRRRSVTKYKYMFPALAFSLNDNNEDVLRTTCIREKNEGIDGGKFEFISWISQLRSPPMLESPKVGYGLDNEVLRGSTDNILDDTKSVVDDGVNTYKATVVLQFAKVSFCYKLEQLIYKLIEFRVFRVDIDLRIALVGQNEARKCTMLTLMTWDLQPLKVMLRRHNYFTIVQFHLHMTVKLDMELSALTSMKRHAPIRRLIRLWHIHTEICGLIFDGAEGHHNEIMSVDFHQSDMRDFGDWLWTAMKVCNSESFRFLLCGIWWIWRNMNDLLFPGRGLPCDDIYAEIMRTIYRYDKVCSILKELQGNHDPGPTRIYCDGSFSIRAEVSAEGQTLKQGMQLATE